MDKEEFELRLIEETKNKHFFDAENDKYKKKVLLYNSFSKVNSYDFNPKTIYSYVLADIYNRYYKMSGLNVMYISGLNNLSLSTLQFCQNHNKDYLDFSSDYKKTIDNLNIGYDSRYFYSLSNKEIIKDMDTFFINHYNKEIFYKNIEVYSTSIKDRFYNQFEVSEENEKYYSKYTNEELFKTNAKVFYLDIEEKENEIREEIEKLNISDIYKENMLKALGDYENLKVSFFIDKSHSLEIELKDPEYMAGISFIALNPKYMDVSEYISEDEYDVVYKYMQNGYDMGRFSGVSAKNPLNFEDINIFISYNFEEAIHVGIPEISNSDKEFADSFGLEYRIITVNNKLIHSDFLDGLNVSDARNKIISEYVSEGAGESVKHFSATKIIISSNDESGAPIPFEIIKDGYDFATLPSNYFPLIYNRFNKVMFGQTPNRPVELINLTFNNLYQTSILKMFLEKPSNYYSEKDFLENEEEFIYKSEMEIEILFPLIFRIIDNKPLRNIKYRILDMSYPDKDNINDSNNLNIHFITDALTRGSRDAIRFYTISNLAESSFEEALNKINQIDGFLNDLYDYYSSGFSDNNLELDNVMYELTNKLNSYLEKNELDLYATELSYVFNNKIKNKKWTEDEALTFLKLLSIICPFIAQNIFETIFHQHDYIIFEEWPRY